MAANQWKHTVGGKVYGWDHANYVKWSGQNGRNILLYTPIKTIALPVAIEGCVQLNPSTGKFR